MPKPMLNSNKAHGKTCLTFNIGVSRKKSNINNKIMLDRILRKKRSKRYMDALCDLDAGGHTHNQHKADEIINAIKEEFPEVDISGIMLGIISKCNLGIPYEVHSIDLSGQIIEHYIRGRSLPAELEKARSIAAQGSYAFIEVYTDCCRAVSFNGTVSVFSC